MQRSLVSIEFCIRFLLLLLFFFSLASVSWGSDGLKKGYIYKAHYTRCESMYVCMYVIITGRDFTQLKTSRGSKISQVTSCSLTLTPFTSLPPPSLPPRVWFFWGHSGAGDFRVGEVEALYFSRLCHETPPVSTVLVSWYGREESRSLQLLLLLVASLERMLGVYYCS